MKRITLLALAGVIVAAVVATAFWPRGERTVAQAIRVEQSTPASQDAATARAPTDSAPRSPAPTPPPAQEPMQAPGGGEGGMFRTDSSGALITDEQARLDLEKLVALNTPQELEKKLQQMTGTLPPPAAQQLPTLVEQYRNYQAAARQVAPSDQAPGSEQEALTLIDTLHGLRVQHFGPEITQGFFGREEQMQRQLIELMQGQTGAGLTLQERVEKAQALYPSAPEKASRGN